MGGEIERELNRMIGVDENGSRPDPAELRPSPDMDAAEIVAPEPSHEVDKPERPPSKRIFDNMRTPPGSPKDLLRLAVQRQYHRDRHYVRVAMPRSERAELMRYARAFKLSPGTVLRVAWNMVERSGVQLNFIPRPDEDEKR